MRGNYNIESLPLRGRCAGGIFEIAYKMMATPKGVAIVFGGGVNDWRKLISTDARGVSAVIRVRT